MHRNYDIFEVTDEGPLWVGSVQGQEAAIQRAAELGKKTANEIRVMYLPDNLVVAAINRKSAAASAA